MERGVWVISPRSGAYAAALGASLRARSPAARALEARTTLQECAGCLMKFAVGRSELVVHRVFAVLVGRCAARLRLLEHGSRHSSGFQQIVRQLMSTEFLGKRKLSAESKAFVSAGVDPLSDEFRQDGVGVATQEKMREGVSQGKRGDHF